jgi:hypothetical protein
MWRSYCIIIVHVVGIVIRDWPDKHLGLKFQRQIFIFSKMSRLALGLTQPLVGLVPAFFPQGKATRL